MKHQKRVRLPSVSQARWTHRLRQSWMRSSLRRKERRLQKELKKHQWFLVMVDEHLLLLKRLELETSLLQQVTQKELPEIEAFRLEGELPMAPRIPSDLDQLL